MPNKLKSGSRPKSLMFSKFPIIYFKSSSAFITINSYFPNYYFFEFINIMLMDTDIKYA